MAADFTADPWLYVMHTSPTDNRVVRTRYTGGALTGTPQVLLTGIPRNKYHNGGRLRSGPDGKLYIATGDGTKASSRSSSDGEPAAGRGNRPAAFSITKGESS